MIGNYTTMIVNALFWVIADAADLCEEID